MKMNQEGINRRWIAQIIHIQEEEYNQRQLMPNLLTLS